MAHRYADRVKEVVITTGLTDYQLLGAGTGFETFNGNLASNDTCHYVCELGAEWEVGLGTFQSPDVLERTTIYASSNGNSPVNWGAGTKTIALTAAAEYFIARNYTDTDVDNILTNHTHTESDITDLDKYTQSEIDNRIVDGGYF